MIKLTSNNVRTIFKKCLFSKDELTKEGLPDSPMIKVEAVSEIYGFRKESVDSVKDDIIELLMQLNEIFFKDIGGGDSFLNAVKNDRGLNWTKSQTDVELLLALGLAIGAITYSLPREMWNILPSGLPYFTINLDKVDVISQYNEQVKSEAKVKAAIKEVQAKIQNEAKELQHKKEQTKPKVVHTEPKADYTDKIAEKEKVYNELSLELKDAEAKYNSAKSEFDSCTVNESKTRSKVETYVKAKSEEVVKTKHVASKATILLDSAKTNLTTAKSNLKMAQQAVEAAERDIKIKTESHDRLKTKCDAAITALEETSESLHKNLNSIVKLRESAMEESSKCSEIVDAIKEKMKHEHDELVKLRELQNESINSANSEESLFETVEVNLPTSKDSDKEQSLFETEEIVSPDDNSSKYGTFTQIAIREYIDKLPEKTKNIIELYHYEQTDPSDIVGLVQTNKASITKAINKFNIELNSILSKDLA